MKKRYILNFPLKSVNDPVTYVLIKEYDIRINILKAAITPEKGGELLVELEADEDSISKGLAYLAGVGVNSEAVDKKISCKTDSCIHCGACTAVCFPGALTMDHSTWKMQFDPEKCVACEMCLKACPLKLFEIKFG